jgi:hypothetical protein
LPSALSPTLLRVVLPVTPKWEFAESIIAALRPSTNSIEVSFQLLCIVTFSAKAATQNASYTTAEYGDGVTCTCDRISLLRRSEKFAVEERD